MSQLKFCDFGVELLHALKAARAPIDVIVTAHQAFLTQEALARISGLSRSTINAVEKQSIGNLSISKAEGLLESIGLSMNMTSSTTRPSADKKAPPSRSPLERAAFLLHDVFDFSFSEVATTLGRSDAACRQHSC